MYRDAMQQQSETHEQQSLRVLRLTWQVIMCHMQGLWERVIRLTLKAARPNGYSWEAVVSFWMRLGPEPEQHLRPAGDKLTQAGESATPALPSNCQSTVNSVALSTHSQRGTASLGHLVELCLAYTTGVLV